MAITGIILHTRPDMAAHVSAEVDRCDDLQVYGLHEDQYLIVVGEMDSTRLEDRLEEVEKMNGVLAVYTTYVNTEDEQLRQ